MAGFLFLVLMFVAVVATAVWQDHRSSGITDGSYAHRDPSTEASSRGMTLYC